MGEKMYVRTPKIISRTLAEETGIHIGDGSMNFYEGHGLYSLRGNKVTDREFYKGHVKRLFGTLYGADVKLREWKDVYGFQITSDKLVKFKNKIMCLPLGKKVNIIIPEILLRVNKLATACVRGILDTDGCIYIENKKGKDYPRIEISTTSGSLANQIRDILVRNGISCSLWKEKYKNKNWNPKFMISVKGYKNFRLWYEIIGTSHSENAKKFCSLLHLPSSRTC
jgi:hypothetical protein